MLTGMTMLGPMDPSLSSLAWALGASDYTERRRANAKARTDKVGADEDDDDDYDAEASDEYSGGVEVAPGAILSFSIRTPLR